MAINIRSKILTPKEICKNSSLKKKAQKKIKYMSKIVSLEKDSIVDLMVMNCVTNHAPNAPTAISPIQDKVWYS